MKRLAIVLAACAPPYQADTIPHATALPCLDVGVTPERAPRGVVLDWRFGNRCDHHVIVDLASVRVSGADRLGVPIALAIRDPRHVVVPLPIGAFDWGHERLEYDPAAPTDVATVEVDIGGVDGSAPRESRALRLELR